MPDSTKESRTYALIFKSIKKAQERLPDKEIDIVPYLQAFTWRRSKMGRKYVFNQLKGAAESSSDGFILWEAGGDYKLGYDELIEFDLDFFKKKLIYRLFQAHDSKRNKEDSG